MGKQINIADAELPIMKVLWERGALTSPEIFSDMSGNKSTLKTLLLRLVQKGAVKASELNGRNYLYTPVVTELEYINHSRQSFLKKVFDGSAQKMLLNFVREENISREDIERLLDLIEEDEG